MLRMQNPNTRKYSSLYNLFRYITVDWALKGVLDHLRKEVDCKKTTVKDELVFFDLPSGWIYGLGKEFVQSLICKKTVDSTFISIIPQSSSEIFCAGMNCAEVKSIGQDYQKYCGLSNGPGEDEKEKAMGILPSLRCMTMPVVDSSWICRGREREENGSCVGADFSAASWGVQFQERINRAARTSCKWYPNA